MTTTIQSDALTATISPLGAEMQTLTTAHGHELLWHGDANWWGGRAPILFPIVGKAPDDRISVGNHHAPMAQHGFARRSLFSLADHGTDYATHMLTDNADTRAQYPFAFSLIVTHRIKGHSLRVEVSIENHDTRPMPFGFGFHPAFAWPLAGADGAPHEIRLCNRAEPEMARLKDGLLPSERHPSPFHHGRLTLSPDMFADDAMIFPTGAGNALRYGPLNDSRKDPRKDPLGGPSLKFTFENLPNLALWTKPDAPFICIEPWHGMAARTGATGEIGDRPHAITLVPKDTAKFAYEVAVDIPGPAYAG